MKRYCWTNLWFGLFWWVFSFTCLISESDSADTVKCDSSQVNLSGALPLHSNKCQQQLHKNNCAFVNKITKWNPWNKITLWIWLPPAARPMRERGRDVVSWRKQNHVVARLWCYFRWFGKKKASTLRNEPIWHRRGDTWGVSPNSHQFPTVLHKHREMEMTGLAGHCGNALFSDSYSAPYAWCCATVTCRRDVILFVHASAPILVYRLLLSDGWS